MGIYVNQKETQLSGNNSVQAQKSRKIKRVFAFENIELRIKMNVNGSNSGKKRNTLFAAGF